MKINWKNTPAKTQKFEDLRVGDTFKNLKGHGAVYMKVQLCGDYDDYGMLELATGKVFNRTFSPLQLVDVEITVDSNKPSIY